VAAVFPAALVARLGVPALEALVFLAAVLIAVACWIIMSQERTERVSRLLLASRGDAKCLPEKGSVEASDSGTSALTALRGAWKRSPHIWLSKFAANRSPDDA
jgi:hypothetical protein